MPQRSRSTPEVKTRFEIRGKSSFLYWYKDFRGVWQSLPETREVDLVMSGYPGSFEQMIDDGGKYQGNIPRPCEHLEMGTGGFNLPSQIYDREIFTDTPIRMSFDGSCGLPDEIYACLPNLSDINVAKDFTRNAFNAFVVQIPEATSLPNFMLEIKELPALLPTIEKWREFLKFVDHARSHYLIRSLKGNLNTVGDVLRASRNEFLKFKFGITPLDGDLNAFLTVAVKIEARLKYLREMNKVKRRVHYRENIDHDLKTLGSASIQLSNGWWLLAKPIQAKTVVTASAEVYSDLEGLSEASARWRATKTALGFNNGLKVVWNAIPYSFVLDYFTQISSFLEPFQAQPFKGKWEVFNVCHSFHTTVNVELSLRYVGFGNITEEEREQRIKTVVVRSYRRRLGLPAGIADLSLDLPTATHSAILAALLDQRVRK